MLATMSPYTLFVAEALFLGALGAETFTQRVSHKYME